MNRAPPPAFAATAQYTHTAHTYKRISLHQEFTNIKYMSRMNIVTPSHSNENDYQANRTDSVQLAPATTSSTTATMTSTTCNPYLDAIWLHGRTLTDTEWNELSIIKVSVCLACLLPVSSFTKNLVTYIFVSNSNWSLRLVYSFRFRIRPEQYRMSLQQLLHHHILNPPHKHHQNHMFVTLG